LFEANNANDADDDARGEVAIISLNLALCFLYIQKYSLSRSQRTRKGRII
jgi:hypothetical protein